MDIEAFRRENLAAFWAGFRRGVTQAALIWMAVSLIGMPWLIRAGC